MRPAHLLLALLAACAMVLATPPPLLVVEVKLWRAGVVVSECKLLEWREGLRLRLNPPADARAILVRVDASTPFKPVEVAFGDFRVVPRVERGVVLIEDFVWINATKLGFVPSEVVVGFGRQAPKPPVYALSDQGGDGVWGYLVSALLKNATVLDLLVDLKLTVLAERPIAIQLSSGNVTLWDVTILAAAESVQALLSRLQGAAVELSASPLYYVADTGRFSKALYVYVNKPAGCQLELGASVKADDVLGAAFPENPALLRPSPTPAIGVGVCSIEFVNPGPYDYLVEGRLVAAGRRAAIALQPSSSPLQASAYRKGILAYNLSIYGSAPRVELPSYAYRLALQVVDARGDPVSNATAVLIGASLRETASIAYGFGLFEQLPPGRYVVSVLASGREVGRSEVSIEGRDEYLTLNVSLTDLELVVIYPNGDRVRGYTVALEDGSYRYTAAEAGGRVLFRGIPTGRYNYVVLKGGVAIAKGAIEVGIGSSSYVVVANVSRVFIKVVSLLGEPIPGMNVEVRGPVTTSAVTGSDGTLALDLPPGLYEVTVPELGLSSQIEVGDGGTYVTLSYVPRELYLAVGALAALAVALLALSRRRGSEIEVLELDE